MKYKNIREEELKNKVGSDWFKSFDTTAILGNIDLSGFNSGKIKHENQANDLFSTSCQPELDSGSQEMLKQVQHDKALIFSTEATNVFDAGRALWKYYHSQQFHSFGGVSEGRGGYNVNASLYDIREYFQGRNDKGRMNSKSDDATYMELIAAIRNKLNFLADKIKPKIYEYEFLKE
jgi:hypothetical protein